MLVSVKTCSVPAINLPTLCSRRPCYLQSPLCIYREMAVYASYWACIQKLGFVLSICLGILELENMFNALVTQSGNCPYCGGFQVICSPTVIVSTVEVIGKSTEVALFGSHLVCQGRESYP